MNGPQDRSLLPCPFCGGKAEVSKNDHDDPVWTVDCDSCPASLSSDLFSKTEAIAAWNRRPAPMEAVAWRETIAAAYIAGAMSVHEYWTENPGEAPSGDPEFDEAAHDYAYAALAVIPTEGGEAPVPKVFDLGPLVGSPLLGTTTPSAKLVIEGPGVVRPGPGAAQMIDSECIHPACGCGDGPCRAIHPDGKAPA